MIRTELNTNQSSWEAHATRLANAPSDEAVFEVYDNLIKELSIKLEAQPRVIFARDTRASGPRLVVALMEAFKASNTEYTDYKILTTPQLHYLTRCLNTKGTPFEYGEPTEIGYYEKTAAAFKIALRGRKPAGAVTVDCANGVGGPKLQELIKYLPSVAEGGLEIKVVNDDVVNPDLLNHQVSCKVQSLLAADRADDHTRSVEQTSSKLVKEHLPPPKLPEWHDVRLWTVTLIV